MAFMIPENITPMASEAEQTGFDHLRRSLPPECTVWHSSALELEESQQVSFLVLGEEIGIAVVTPLGWELPEALGLLERVNQQLNTPKITPEQSSELRAAVQRFHGLKQLLVESQIPDLANQEEDLRPAYHQVFILDGYRSRDVNARNLRIIAENVLVLANDEVSQLYDVLRQQTAPNRQLTGSSFNAVRLVVSPSIEVHLRRRKKTTTTLEGDLEYQSAGSEDKKQQIPLMLDLRQEQVVKSFAHMPVEHQSTAKDLDARLIRGVVGSGKSLILLHRAKFLSQINPNWKILFLTYNRSLADFLRTRIRDLPGPSGDIEIINFHAWCRRFLYQAGLWRKTDLDYKSRKGLIAHVRSKEKSRLGQDDLGYLVEEFDWIRDQGFTSQRQYAEAKRRGRERKLGKLQRQEVWDLLQLFRSTMRKNGQFDWPEVPLMMVDGIDQGRIAAQKYHAILVDEAQDFAPSWFTVAQHMLRPATNMLFIAADVAQKIYRRPLSWRALGIDVTGRRSRILNRSYRNTYEILRVAYELIGNDRDMEEELRREGDQIIKPELDGGIMRRGPLPIIMQFTDRSREMEYISNEVKTLSNSGYEWDEIAIIHRDYRFLRDLAGYLNTQGVPSQIVRGVNINLASPDVKLLTLHSSKGLEFSAVFITGVDRLQTKPGLTGEELAQAVAEEKRLLYVGMTRARERLYIMHVGPLPVWVAAALTMVERQE